MHERIFIAGIDHDAIFVLDLAAIRIAEIIDDSKRIRKAPLSKPDRMAERLCSEMLELPGFRNSEISIVARKDEQSSALHDPADAFQDLDSILMPDRIDAVVSE